MEQNTDIEQNIDSSGNVFSIVADHREKSINVCANENKQILQKYSINYHITTLYTGDFLISIENMNAVAIFERKTWKDLSDSIKDGRISNIEKLRAYREQTGCMIIYILEGKIPSNSIGRITSFAMKSHLFHLMMRDGVFLIYTKSPENTFITLIEFARSIRSFGVQNLKGLKSGGEEVDNHVQLAKNYVVQTDEHIINNMWKCIKNTRTLLAELQESHHIIDLITGVVSIEEISNLRYPSGVSFGEKRAKQLLDSAIRKETHVKILHQLPSFSIKISQQILENTTLPQLLENKEYTVAYLTQIIGKKRIETFLRIFFEG